MLDKYIGLGHDETTKVLEALARFHALTYHLLRYEGEKYFEGEEVAILGRNLWTKDNVNWEAAAKFFGGSTKIGIEFIAAEDEELAAKVKLALGDIQSAGKIVKSTTLKTDSVYFPCILHGDLWTNNILFKYINGKVAEVKFVDFQQSRRGNIFEDLQYFLFTSTTPDTRREFLNQWMESYYSSFTKTLTSVNCPNPPNFSRGFFIDEMWSCFLSGYAYMHFAIPFQLGIFTPLEGEVDEPIERSEGPPSLDEICRIQHTKFRKWMKRSPAARKRLVEITREFVEYGII